MDGKEFLIKAGMQRRKAEKYAERVGKALDELLKDVEKKKKNKKNEVVLESKDIMEPLNTYSSKEK